MHFLGLLSFAFLGHCRAAVVGRDGDASRSATSSTAGRPSLVDVRPPLPIFNGSTYSQLAPTGTEPQLLTTGGPTGGTASASNVVTYNGHVFSTLCPGGHADCLTTCKSYVHAGTASDPNNENGAPSGSRHVSIPAIEIPGEMVQDPVDTAPAPTSEEIYAKITATTSIIEPSSVIMADREPPTEPKGADPLASVQDDEAAHPEQTSPAQGHHSQTVTARGSAQTISEQLVSLAPTEIIVGSSEIGIPRIQAGTQPISLPAGSDSALMWVTFIAGQVSPDSTITVPPTTTSARSNAPSLASIVPRAVFRTGTYIYTAIQAGGTAEGVIGKTTLTQGEAVSFKGGTVSLVSEHLEVEQNTGTTGKHPQQKATVEGAVVTLEPTTMSSFRLPNGNVVYGSKTSAHGDEDMFLGSQRPSRANEGIVVVGASNTRIIELQRTTVTTKSKSLSHPESTSSSSPSHPSTPHATSPPGSKEVPGATTANITTSSSAKSFQVKLWISVATAAGILMWIGHWYG